MQTITPQEFQKRYGTAGVQAFKQPAPKTPGQKFGEVATGFAKGGLQTAIGTAQMVQGLGQRTIAAIDPTRTLDQVKQETGFKSLQGPAADQINTQLEAKTPYEKGGKVLEFAAELLWPVGKTTEVANLASKGKKIIGAELSDISSKLTGFTDDVSGAGSEIKNQIIDLVTTLDDKTKTALMRTPKEKFLEVVEQGKQALLDDKNRTPLEMVGDKIVEGLIQVKDRAMSIGKNKADYLNQAKIGLQPAGNIVKDSFLQVQKQFSNIKLDKTDAKLVGDVMAELKKIMNNPRIKDVDQVIDFLQEKLYKTTSGDVVQVTDRVVGPLRKILGELNGKVGKIGGTTYQKFNQEYSDLISIVRELNKRVGKEGSSAGSFIKRLFSPSDARTKELFEQLQKYTGQDYFRDARLAKFIMETLGDTRAASLLEQIPTSVSGLAGKAINYAKNKIADPIDAAQRFIEKNAPK